jgi:regulator of protease activity HflC (stomatin/prohibitin superfamily)
VAATLETLTTAGATAEELLPAQRELDRAEHRLEGTRLEDDNQRYYESVIRGIPVGGPNGVWEAARGTVESTLRDVLMSELSEKLFDVSGVTLAGRLAERNIKKIEDFVLEKCRESLTERGIVLVGIDITQVDFPPEIQEKLKYEVNEQIEARVKKEQAETKKALAKAEAECRVTRAEAENDSANHLAKAMKIFTEAKANHYQRIIEVLQAYKLSESAQAEVVKSIAASSATGDDLQNTMKLAAQFAKGQEPPDTPPRP